MNAVNAGSDERTALEESLAQSRVELEAAVDDLKEAARETLTPGEVLARRKYLWLASAFAVGVLLSRD